MAENRLNEADNQAKALWAAIKSDASFLWQGILSLITGDPADFSQDTLDRISQLNDPNFPAFLQAVQAAKQAQIDYNRANTALVDAEQQYKQDEQELSDAIKALDDCLAAHGRSLARPLGAPPPPSLARPLGAPPPPKLQ